jgi:hypothetical protein
VQRGELNSQPWRPRDPADSVGRGLALVPEERRKEGIFIEEPIAMNLAVSADNSFSRWSLFGHRQAWRWAEEVIARVGVRATGPGQAAPSFRRQPEVAIGKWLRNDANVLIFDEPTKGVDVKAKTDLFQLIDGLAREGKGVIYASGEFAELVGYATASACCGTDASWRRSPARGPGRDTTLLFNRRNGSVSKALSVNAAASGRQRFFDFLYKWGMLLTVVALVAVFGLASDNFLDPFNIINILRSIAIVTVIAIGVSISLTIGGFDLSVGSTASLANALVISLFVWHGFGTTERF